MPKFCTIVDDFGREVSLTLSSPQLIKVLLQGSCLSLPGADFWRQVRSGGSALLGRCQGYPGVQKFGAKTNGWVRALATKACWAA
eukprot:6099279-Pyramimonas_sp.AAC.1